MATLVLDKTGTSSANLIVNEKHDVSSKTKRIFVPNKGAFFGKGLIIRDASTNKILQPVTGYKVLHMVREAVRETNKEVYAVILITDTGVLDVIIQYQAVGGIYANVGTEITSLLDAYLDGRTPQDTIGQIVGAPIQVLPEHHIQNIADFQQAGAALSVLEGIRKAIMLGDTNAFGAVYQHIDNVFNDAKADITAISDHFNSLYDQAESRFVRRQGSVIITDEDANPSTYTDGKWQRLPNVFLFGSTINGDVGKTIDVAEGTGLVARKTNFFVRDDNGDGIVRVINANKTAITEGETVNFTLTTIGLPSGSKLAYTLSGITADDLTSGSLTGEFTTNSAGIAAITVSIKRDFKTEGNEVLKCYLTAFPGTYDSVVINDTSKTPTYKLVLGANTSGSIPLTSIDEGSSFYATVITTDVDPNTKLNLLYTGQTNSTDFTGTLPSTVTIGSDGIGYVAIPVSNDYLTEGVETLTISVSTSTNTADIKVTSSININDTSKTKVYSSRWSSSSTGSGTISSVNEGDTAYLVITTENVPQGAILNLTYSGITSDDLVDAIPTSITIYNNLAIIPVTLKSDSLSEGNETLRINISEGSTVVSTTSLVINDTSKTPTYAIRYSTNSNGTDTITSVNEGQTIYAIIETTNVNNSTIMQIGWSGVSAADFTELPATTVTIIGNIGAVKLAMRDDFTTEGVETLTVSASLGGQVRASKSIAVADTSISVSGTITFSKTSAVSGAITEVNEDESTVYILYKTVDIPNGTVLGIGFEGVENADMIGTFPTTVTIQNNVASTSFKVTKDWITEGDQYLVAKLLLPNGAVVQNSIAIRDTSLTPVIDKLYYSKTSTGTEPVTSVGEDQTVYLVFETTNIPNGTTMPITWSGTAVAADFVGTRPTTVTINNGKGFVTIKTLPDYVNESTETCIATATLPGTNGTKAATLNILDTHKVQTVKVRFSNLPDGSGAAATSVNEGSVIYAIIEGTNILDNQEVTLAWSGNTTDLAGTLPTKVTMVGNKASVTITAIADKTREDTAESVTLRATTPSGATNTGTFTINDTSKGYATAVWRTGNSTTAPEVPATGTNEGDIVFLHITTFGIPAERLYLEWSGVNVTNDDWYSLPHSDWLSGSNTSIISYVTRRDYVTEGTETVSVTVKDSKGNVLVTTSLKILDASKTPTFSAVFSTDAGGVNTFTSVDEPTSGIKNIYAVVKTTNMFNGDVVQFTFSGDADNNDFSGTPITGAINVTINNNIGYYNLKLLADNADG